MAQNFLSFFTDPILRAPTIGCMLMCLSAGLIGVIVFLRKQSLIGEALSHAAYPGIILGAIVAGLLSIDENQDFYLSVLALSGAFLTSLLGLGIIYSLEKYLRVPNDAALCFVLSTFFGIGLTLSSEVQFSFTMLYKQVLTYLYGQAATMTDTHVMIYGGLSFIIICVVLFFYKELQIITFDKQYAKSLGIRVKLIEALFFVLTTLSIIIGIRSVGVILMSAMLIAPAVAARQFTHRLSYLLFLAAFFGLISGFLGNYFSVELTEEMAKHYPNARIILPTGPMIVISVSMICLFALLFAPEKGLVVRFCRIAGFKYSCINENILKLMWRLHADQKGIVIQQIAKYQNISKLYLIFILKQLVKKGWLKQEKSGAYYLTIAGKTKAEKIVRLHRLWEVYLANYLGVGIERVHRNAEEMEHILTPEIEKELILLLNNPQLDPHHQPIPSNRDFYA